MSLKTFHIFFITVSTLLCFGLSIWAFRSFGESQNGLLIVAGILAIATGVGLIAYGIRFLKKLRHVSFL